MKALFLTSSYPLYPGDWRGGFVRDLGAALVARGVDVDVAVPRPATGEFVPDEDGPRAFALPSVLPGRARGFHGAGLESNLLHDPLAAFAIPPFLLAYASEVLLHAWFADVVVSHWIVPMGAVGAVVARAAKKPLVIVAHSAPPAVFRVPGMTRILRAVLGASAVTVCVSDTVRAAIEAMSPSACRLETLALGVDLRPAILPSRQEARLRALFVGRLVPLKGVDILLRAIAGVQGVELTVVGDGPEAENLRKLAADLGVPARFAGELSAGETRDLMSSHDVLVVPSIRGWFGREEGLPRVIAEAWACGLPVIASDSGGGGEAVLRTGAGMMVRASDAGEIRRAFQALRDSPELRFRLASRALEAGREMSWDVLAPKWESLLRQIARA